MLLKYILRILARVFGFSRHITYPVFPVDNVGQGKDGKGHVGVRQLRLVHLHLDGARDPAGVHSRSRS